MLLSYDKENRAEPSRIYIAKPGQRLLGQLNGVEEDTVSLEINLNNTHILTFTLDRIVDGEISNFYEFVGQHYELYVTNFGWFKINEEPVLDNDGKQEHKEIRAESLEIELQQYDLFGFRINTASADSWEMLAVDNTYRYDDTDYYVPRQNIQFYRDATGLAEGLKTLPTNVTDSKLPNFFTQYPQFVNSWRITPSTYQFDTGNGFNEIAELIHPSDPDYYSRSGALQTFRTSYNALSQTYAGDSLVEEKRKMIKYYLINYFPEYLNDIVYTYNYTEEKQSYDVVTNTYSYTTSTITPYQLLKYYIDQTEQTSFMTLTLRNTGWKVGYVDDSLITGDNAEFEGFLAEQVGKFDVNNKDVYSFLTQEASVYFRCIFAFDTYNYKVNCYRLDNLGWDTSIFLSFHNIQNSVTRSGDEYISTVFNVSNEDTLDIKDVNFGSHEIEDLSYFMTTDHFSQRLINLYNRWLTYRENQRTTYRTKSIQYRQKLEEAAEIYDRVPVDGLDTGQWGGMSREQLEATKADYQALLRGYEAIAVDEWNNFSKKVLATMSFCEDYYMIQNIVIPNIDTALYNLAAEKTEDERDYYDIYSPGYILDATYDSEGNRSGGYGNSYGVAELQLYITTCDNAIKSYKNFSKDSTDEFDHAQYLVYKKYVDAKANAQRTLATRQSQYNSVRSTITTLSGQLDSLTASVQKENFSYNNEKFTDDDLELLNKYYIHTDYTNENIITTSTMKPEELINQDEQLYQDAKAELYAAAHPQYIFETTQDNLLLMPEFNELVDVTFNKPPSWVYNNTKNWDQGLWVGNYIRVSIRDDYQVKLRITSIILNPCMVDEEIQLKFSNMIQYKSKRNDFVSLMQDNGGTGKNSINAEFANRAGFAESVSITTDLVTRLIANTKFSNYVSSAATGMATSLAPGATVHVGKITGSEADFDKMFTKYLQANTIVTNMLNASTAKIDELQSVLITSDEVVTKLITATDAEIQTVQAKLVDSDRVVAAILEADQATITNLQSELITSDTVVTALLEATDAIVARLTADTAFMHHLESNLIVASEIKVDDLKAKLAQIDTLAAGSAFVQYLQSISSTTATSVINDAYIANAVVGKISVGDLAAGNIVLTDSMQILSENGKMTMNGSALQIHGTDSSGNDYVGIQLGYDTNDNPSLVLRNEDGATILTPSGITSNAIADSLIVNNMISNGTIQKSKLGFQIMEPNAQGGIDITQVYDGEGNQWGLQYNSFKTATTDALSDLQEEIDNYANYDLYIEAPSGTNIISGGNITFTVHLMRNNEDVTDEYDASCFIWTRMSQDHNSDIIWNQNHSTGTKTLTVTSSDVTRNANFQCKFESASAG